MYGPFNQYFPENYNPRQSPFEREDEWYFTDEASGILEEHIDRNSIFW